MAYNVERFLEHGYHGICLLSTTLLVSWCIHIYQLDEDVSRIKYTKFHENADMVYPSISICFGNIFLREKFQHYGVNLSLYKKFLKGDYFSKDFPDIPYDNLTADPSDFLLGIKMSQVDRTIGNLNPGHKYWYDHTKNLSNSHLSITYSMEKIWKPSFYVDEFDTGLGLFYKCLAIDVPFVHKAYFSWLTVVMKKSIFPEGQRPMSASSGGVFIVSFAYPNQRIRYSTKVTTWNQVITNGSYGTKFQVNGMEVVNYRNKRSEPCDEDWKNDDDKIMNQMIRDNECVPVYWKTQLNISYPRCSTKRQMKTFYLKRRQIDNYTIPCRSISKLSFHRSDFVTKIYDKNFDGIYKAKYFSILMNFPHDLFKEIVMVRSFDAQTLIGNAGGYIGLCLGYTFLQLPILLRYVFAFLKHRLETKGRTNDTETKGSYIFK
jgi:hypothetical protein